MSVCKDVDSPHVGDCDPEENFEVSEAKVSQCEELLPNISQAFRNYFTNIAKAVEWLSRNKKLLKSVAKEPGVINMTEQDIIQVIEEREEPPHSVIDDWH